MKKMKKLALTLGSLAVLGLAVVEVHAWAAPKNSIKDLMKKLIAFAGCCLFAADAYAQIATVTSLVGTVSDSKFTRVAVTEGDRIQLDSAGGGGFGSPQERPRELVAEDVRQGFVSPQAARELYGYETEEGA